VLVRLNDSGALAIGQLSHSWLAGQLARSWGNSLFCAVEPREEVALGAEQHDIGWALFDLEPRFNPDTGLPKSFLELSVQEHLAIWRGAPEHLMSQSMHAALVVSMHGRSLSELRMRANPAQAEGLKAHVEEERTRQQQICEALSVSAALAERTQRQMWTWDGLSLALCNAWRPFAANAVPTTEGLTTVELRDRSDGTSTLEPWPFSARRIEVRCEARHLDARYADEAAMRRAFELAEPTPLTFELRAP
jgi:hypothetical protein